MILFCYISYYCLDVARGESLDYAAEIAKKFNTEFPKARLTISYDIACKLKNIFAVIIILSLHLPTFLEAKGQLFQALPPGYAFVLPYIHLPFLVQPTVGSWDWD